MYNHALGFPMNEFSEPAEATAQKTMNYKEHKGRGGMEGQLSNPLVLVFTPT